MWIKSLPRLPEPLYSPKRGERAPHSTVRDCQGHTAKPVNVSPSHRALPVHPKQSSSPQIESGTIKQLLQNVQNFSQEFCQNIHEFIRQNDMRSYVTKIVSINGFNERIQNILFRKNQLVHLTPQRVMNQIYIQMKLSSKKVELSHQNKLRLRKSLLEHSSEYGVKQDDFTNLIASEEFDYDLMSKLHYYNKNLEDYIQKNNQDLVNNQMQSTENEQRLYQINLNKYMTKHRPCNNEAKKDFSAILNRHRLSASSIPQSSLLAQLEDLERRLGKCDKIEKQVVRKCQLLNNLEEIQHINTTIN